MSLPPSRATVLQRSSDAPGTDAISCAVEDKCNQFPKLTNALLAETAVAVAAGTANK
jgi:hypothetical protein